MPSGKAEPLCHGAVIKSVNSHRKPNISHGFQSRGLTFGNLVGFSSMFVQSLVSSETRDSVYKLKSCTPFKETYIKVYPLDA